MGRRVADDSRAEPLQADLDALDMARRNWYRSCLNRGDSPAEALEKARAYVPARERVRAWWFEDDANAWWRRDDGRKRDD